MRCLSILAAVAATVTAVPYQQYILAPSSRSVRPTAVFRQHGAVTSPNALLDAKTPSGRGLVLGGFNSSVTYDFGKNIAGLVNLDIRSRKGSVGVTFSESSLWVSSAACDATADAGLDAPLVFNITRPGIYEAPPDKERGAFRYLTVVNTGTERMTIRDLWVHYTAMPHWKDDELRAYTGWFHSSDEKLNRVWYAGAYTNQLVTINPKRGDALNFINITNNSTVNGTLDWWLNTTITEGSSVLTDGAKRDRLVWSGDMAIAVPGIAVTTFDLISIRNALDSLFKLQNANGQLPYAGVPFNERGIVSFTYHLYALIGVANFYHWSGDQSYLDAKWAAWKAGMEWAAQQIDATGLANITAPADWLRFGMGGHNIEANSILFYTLNLGVTLAQIEGDPASASRWAQLASGIQAAAVPLLWQPDAGLFRDNETTTLAPQDGNAWAVKSGLVSSPAQVTQISTALQARWGPYGAPAPEAADAVSPFSSGFELEAHFLANRTGAALALVRRMWADFMLDDPRMTNSTFIEGYSITGELHYAPYANDPRISHAHGWATGPTSSLTCYLTGGLEAVRSNYEGAKGGLEAHSYATLHPRETFIGGIQLLSSAGRTWSIAPQLGDLAHADAGFSTSIGQFSSKWSTDGTVFRLQISTPKGTTGSVAVPLPGSVSGSGESGDNGGARVAAKLTVAGASALRGTETTEVRGDAAGRYWLNGLEGGEYEFVAVAM
ncbi:bacterial alpha-L-rhamnosidase domain protein [Earliella scabrosa]|nr:bacterial alpha-L-rhamnosidase domain protein [Earliella scabrosa]